MVYLRAKTMNALYNAKIEPDDWPKYANDAILEKIAREKKK